MTGMSFLDMARRRQSVRSYLPRPVERSKIERCLEAARLAPSASNAQPWHFVVADDPALARELGKACYNRFTRSVPAFAAVVCEPGKAVDRLGWLAGRDYRLKQALPSSRTSCGSSATTKCQGWALEAEGARRAASRQRSILSRSTDWGR